MIIDFIQALIGGVMIGSVLAMIATGLCLIFGITKIMNFAHGDFIMIGMYCTFWLYAIWGISPFVSMVLLVVPFFIFGVLMYKGFFSPFLKESLFVMFLGTIGMAYVLQGIATTLWGGGERVIFLRTGVIRVGGLTINSLYLTFFVISAVTLLALHYFLAKTEYGKTIAAASESEKLAEVRGINVSKIYTLIIGLGFAMVAIAACFLGSIHKTCPFSGGYFTLLSFFIVLTGGLGNLKGSLVMGISVGITQSLVAEFLGGGYVNLVIFVVFLIIIFLKPGGLFGTTAEIRARLTV